MDSTPRFADRASGRNQCGGFLFKIFRKAASNYFESMVMPYLKLPGPVEIDETKVGQKKFEYMAKYSNYVRWVFGLFCRTTRIPILYYIPDKKHTTLSALVRKHVDNGTILMSDCHSSYLTLSNLHSKMTQYGYFHYWINHSLRYVHEKY